MPAAYRKKCRNTGWLRFLLNPPPGALEGRAGDHDTLRKGGRGTTTRFWKGGRGTTTTRYVDPLAEQTCCCCGRAVVGMGLMLEGV